MNFACFKMSFTHNFISIAYPHLKVLIWKSPYFEVYPWGEGVFICVLWTNIPFSALPAWTLAVMFSIDASARIEMTPVPTKALPLLLKLHVVVVCSGTEIGRLARQEPVCVTICMYTCAHTLWRDEVCEYMWDLLCSCVSLLYVFMPVLQICVLVWR